MLLSGLCAVMVSSCDLSGSDGSRTVGLVKTPSPSPDLAPGYNRVMDAERLAMSSAVGGAIPACTGMASTCLAAAQQIDEAIDGFTTDTSGLGIPNCERRAFAEFQRSVLMLRSATQEIRSALDGQASQWAASNASLQEAAWHNDRSRTLHTIDCG
jgi:uncharacterized protein YukE